MKIIVLLTGFCELIKNSKPTSVTPCSLIGINSSVRIKTFAGLASVGKTLWSRYGVSVAWGPSPSPPQDHARGEWYMFAACT